jgi:hypothetical protein
VGGCPPRHRRPPRRDRLDLVLRPTHYLTWLKAHAVQHATVRVDAKVAPASVMRVQVENVRTACPSPSRSTTECSLGEGGHRGDAADEGKSTSGPSRSREVAGQAEFDPDVRVQILAVGEQEPHSTPAQVALARLLVQATTSPGPRHKRVSRKENTAAAAVELSGEHIARLNDLTLATGGRHNEANASPPSTAELKGLISCAPWTSQRFIGVMSLFGELS